MIFITKYIYIYYAVIISPYTVWCDGLWVKLWGLGVRGKMWRVIKRMYEASRSAVLLDEERSASLSAAQGEAQGCSLSLILIINDLLKEVEEAELGMQLSAGKIELYMLFADNFVGVSDLNEQLHKINQLHSVISNRDIYAHTVGYCHCQQLGPGILYYYVASK